MTRNMILTKGLDSNELRFVLTWGDETGGASADLDIYLYGPNPFQDGEYQVSFSNQEYWGQNHYGNLMNGEYVYTFAELDVDDKSYEGPETITVKAVTKGQYKIFVHDYSNGGSGNQLYASNPAVKVYRGNTLVDTVKMPEKEGGAWFVGSYDNTTGKISIADEVYNGRPNISVRAQIGSVLNQLTQFDITDASVFAKDKKLIEEATENYLKKISEEQLSSYLTDLSALLEKLKNGLTMKKISIAGAVKGRYNAYVSNHNLYYFYGTHDTLTDLNVEFQDENASFRLEKLDGQDGYSQFQYRLILENAALGVSTNYYFDYVKETETEQWVNDIQDPDNIKWNRRIDLDRGYTGGMNADIGRNLNISLLEGISISSKEYRTDAIDGEWEYGENIDLVLHLQKEGTEETRDYPISYKPFGAELVRITDTENQIVSQEVTNYDSWYVEDSVKHYRVTGENPEMGESWKAEVSEGASYELSDFNPDGESYYDSAPVKVLTVTHPNGARQVYYIYYYMDTSDAEIIGIYDPNNMYTSYTENAVTTSSGTYYNISLSGMNSELGNSLSVHTRTGASAKVEYVSGSESWDTTSQAKITVTASSGKERIYYVMYRKSNVSNNTICNIRSISSKTNTLKKVWIYYSNTIYIIGSDAALGGADSLEIATDPGYTAVYDENDPSYYGNGKITVTEDATGKSVSYYVNYSQDASSIKIKNIVSKQGLSSVTIADSLSVASQTGEKYYRVELVGDLKECPKDLEVYVPENASATILYAGEDWQYAAEYAAKIEVSDGTNKALYLAAYRQDDSKAAINGITDASNQNLKADILESERYFYFKETGENGISGENAYVIYVKGDNKELGNGYQLHVSNGSSITDTMHKADSGWKYREEFLEYSQFDGNGNYVLDTYALMDRVTVTAANGAERVYVIAYAQDKSGAVISKIEDEENNYYHTFINGSAYSMELNPPEGEDASELVYLIYVYGDKKELGTSYQLNVPKGSVISTTHKGDAAWNYRGESTGYTFGDGTGNVISDRYVFTDRVVVTAANGAERIYVIAYAQESQGAVVSGITDAKNDYIKTDISVNATDFSIPPEEGSDGKAQLEPVYLIYVTGSQKELGSSYELLMPNGGSIKSVMQKGDAGWHYGDSVDKYEYDEEGRYVLNTYYYADRVAITAENGAERIYLIAYAQDISGVKISKITDANNDYIYANTTGEQALLSVDATGEGDVSEETVYVIYVKGSQKELGSSYELSLPEGSVVRSTAHKGDEGWHYTAESRYHSYFDEEENYVSDNFYYTDRVTVTAANGATRVYVIAYAPMQTESPDLTAEQIYADMIAMKSEYPEGMTWTNDNYYAWNGGMFSGGYGCTGFAFALSDAAFGSLPARRHEDFSNICVGDIVRMDNDAHSVIVLEVQENGVIVAEGNYNSSVHWEREIPFTEIENTGTYVLTRYPE